MHAILNVPILVALREVSRGRPKQVELVNCFLTSHFSPPGVEDQSKPKQVELVTCLLTSHFSPPGVEPGEQVCEQSSVNVCIFAGFKIGEIKNYF